MPLVACLLDGQKYFRSDDLPPPSGDELLPLYRPRITQTNAPARPRGPYSLPPWAVTGRRKVASTRHFPISSCFRKCSNTESRFRFLYRQLRKKKVHVPFVHQRLHEQSSGPRNLWIGLTAYFA
jgi:hypothetical protein